jgi:hypothetical protein
VRAGFRYAFPLDFDDQRRRGREYRHTRGGTSGRGFGAADGYGLKRASFVLACHFMLHKSYSVKQN